MGLRTVLHDIINNEETINILKVPHHGSKTSYDLNQWKKVLREPESSILKMTCWSNGSKFLPEDTMIQEFVSNISVFSLATTNPHTKYEKTSVNLRRTYTLPVGKLRIHSKFWGSIGTWFDDKKKELIIAPSNSAIFLKDINK